MWCPAGPAAQPLASQGTGNGRALVSQGALHSCCCSLAWLSPLPPRAPSCLACWPSSLQSGSAVQGQSSANLGHSIHSAAYRHGSERHAAASGLQLCTALQMAALDEKDCWLQLLLMLERLLRLVATHPPAADMESWYPSPYALLPHLPAADPALPAPPAASNSRHQPLGRPTAAPHNARKCRPTGRMASAQRSKPAACWDIKCIAVVHQQPSPPVCAPEWVGQGLPLAQTAAGSAFP